MNSCLLTLLLCILIPGQALAAVVQPVRIETPPLSGVGLPGVSLVNPTLSAAPAVSAAPSLAGALPSVRTLNPAVAPVQTAAVQPVLAKPVQAAVAQALSAVHAPNASPEGAPGPIGRPGTAGQDVLPTPAAQAFSQGRALFDGVGSIHFNNVDLPVQAFSDQTPLSSHIIRAIDAAQETVEVALHGIALESLAEALVRAKERGVRVRVVMNRSHVYPEKPGRKVAPEVQMLIDAGVEMRLLRGTREHGIMHNKFALIDGKILESGSYNWTHAADEWNYENVFFTNDRHRIEGYSEYWKWMWGLSKPLGDRAPPLSDEDLDVKPPVDTLNPIRFHDEELPAYAFAPAGGIEETLVRAIDAARKTVDLAMFSLTLSTVQQALLAARERGVRVRIVFDRSQYGFLPAMQWFTEQGFDVLVTAGRRTDKGVLHYKFAVFDGVLAESGSYNYTFNAEKNNFENANFFDDKAQVSAFTAAFERVLRKAISPSQDLELMEVIRQNAQRMANAVAKGRESSGRGPKRAQVLETEKDVVKNGLDPAYGL
ncbi:MAG: phosphatidylserine/phosphatidylglycerophosphate/cardiolipin synthase family protein [Elusimicrobiota bacterium]